MKEEIFRKKSLDQIKSPEDLHDYVRVSNPGVWLLLIAMGLLLAGTCVWGMFGRIDLTVKGSATVSDHCLSCVIPETDGIAEGSSVTVGNTVGTVREVRPNGDNALHITAEIDLPDGAYSADFVTESVRPLSFVLN